MANTKGVYVATKKDGSLSYRVSITLKKKHISLGSYDNLSSAEAAYLEAKTIMSDDSIVLESYAKIKNLMHDKFIILLNLRDNGIYFPTPIYVRRHYFEYYLTKDQILKFDRDDLFFYAAHKIQKKGGYLFISNYGSQYNILGRYGVRDFAVYGRDYEMINGDKNDYRYTNIRIMNQYVGVTSKEKNGKSEYTSTIHINGNYILGRYETEEEAAIAYNKAVDTIHAAGKNKGYAQNYISSLKPSQYAAIYEDIPLSDKFMLYIEDLKKDNIQEQ